MNVLRKRVKTLEQKMPEPKERLEVERIIIGQNEAGEWVEHRIIKNGEKL